MQPVRFVLMRTIFHFLSHFALVLLSTPLLTPPHSSLAHWTLLLPAHNFYLLASCSGTLCSLGRAEQVRQLWAMMTCCFVGCWQRDTQQATHDMPRAVANVAIIMWHNQTPTLLMRPHNASLFRGLLWIMFTWLIVY